MPVTKQSAPGNDDRADQPTETKQAANTTQGDPTEGQHPADQTGQGNTPFPADAREDQVNPTGYHDSQSGRAVTKDGIPVDQADGTDPIPAHRIVADDWASRPEK